MKYRFIQHVSIHPSIIHSPIHQSSIRPFIDFSLTYSSIIYWPVHAFSIHPSSNHLFVHSFLHHPDHPSIPSFIQLPIHSFISTILFYIHWHLKRCFSIQRFIHTFIHPFIHSPKHLSNLLAEDLISFGILYPQKFPMSGASLWSPSRISAVQVHYSPEVQK